MHLFRFAFFLLQFIEMEEVSTSVTNSLIFDIEGTGSCILVVSTHEFQPQVKIEHHLKDVCSYFLCFQLFPEVWHGVEKKPDCAALQAVVTYHSILPVAVLVLNVSFCALERRSVGVLFGE